MTDKLNEELKKDTMTNEEFINLFKDEALKERAEQVCDMTETTVKYAQKDCDDHINDIMKPGVNLNYVQELHEWLNVLDDKKMMLLVSETVNRVINQDDLQKEDAKLESPIKKEIIENVKDHRQDEKEIKEITEVTKRLESFVEENGITGKMARACMMALLSTLIKKRMNEYIDLIEKVAQVYDKKLIETVQKEVQNG